MYQCTFSKIIILSFGFFILWGCNKSDFRKENTWTWDAASNLFSRSEVLARPTLLGDNIYLPKGTKWRYTNQKHHEVMFDLPEGYAFLLRSEHGGESQISATGGGYSCTCSGGGGCTTFYNEDIGYGCLQHTCTGSCIGKKTKTESAQTIEGVLLIDNDLIDGTLPTEKASLSEVGKAIFFDVKAVQDEIKRTYNIIYKHLPKPNFSSLNFETEQNYIFTKAYLYGFEIGLILPNDPSIKKWMPELKIMSLVEASKACKCSGISGTSCKIKRAGLLGYEAYYCSGCTTCEMN